MLALLRQLALRGSMLAAQLAHDQEDHADHDDDRQRRGEELQPGLRPPVGERGLDVLVVATIRIGKCVSDLTAPTLSSDNLALVKRPEILPSTASAR